VSFTDSGQPYSDKNSRGETVSEGRETRNRAHVNVQGVARPGASVTAPVVAWGVALAALSPGPRLAGLEPEPN